MSKIQFGKAIKDIPFNKIVPGIRVAAKYPDKNNCILGTVLKTKADTYNIITVSVDDGQPNKFSEKGNLIAIEWDEGPIATLDHKSGSLFFVEHEGK